MVLPSILARHCLVAGVLCFSASIGSAAAIEPAPHRAIYDLSMKSGIGRGDVAGVSGTMVYEWQDSCDGWSLTQRTAMRLLYSTGDELDLGWNLVSWESKDGTRYRFFVRKLENGELTEEFRGEARMDGNGGGTAEYSLPEARTVKLPAGTMFPSQHTFALIKRIEADEGFFWATVFDGSDAEGLFSVSAVVANRMPAEAGAEVQRELLAGVPSSRVHLAFFNATANGAEPEHEQTLRLYHNGIVEDLVLDFGDFEVAAKLKELKNLTPPC